MANNVKSSDHLIDPEVYSLAFMSASEKDNSGDIVAEHRAMMKKYAQSDEKTAELLRKMHVETEEGWIKNIFDNAEIKLLITRSINKADTLQPLIYSIHGGGMVSGNAEIECMRHAQLASSLNFIGVSVDYRLAPEFHQPVQLNDCYSGLKWCIDNAKKLNIDTEKVAVWGGSAGAGLSAGLAIFVRDRREFKIQHLQLVQPMLDDRTGITETHPYNGQYVYTKEQDYFGWKSVLNQEPGSDGVSAYYSPARAESLQGLPPTFLCVGSIELFADETLDFAKKLMYSGVPVELHVYPGIHHLGLSVPTAYSASRATKAAQDALIRFLHHLSHDQS
ncbi:MAG: alpha/beta hydrolase [Gracilibacteraceae bacterium]|jgi:acetyl esterase/lipase|nr:alpha/beta hydrolase [Gracilibacteraceae bacterium]